MTRQDLEKYQLKTLMVLNFHRGRENPVDMGELYSRVFGRPWRHKINDTRDLRRVVTLLRRSGQPICSVSSKEGGGYYMASAGSEVEDYKRRMTRKALRLLAQVATISKIALPELLGQMQLNLQKEAAVDE